MNNAAKVKPLSEAISNPIIKAYKAGGLGLVFVFIGTLLLLIALFFGQQSIFGYVIGIIGSLMILIVLWLFYFQDIKKLKEINDNIQKNQELLDTIQATAIEMTDLAYQLQALSFKHADQVASFITLFRQNIKGVISLPFTSKVPGIDQVSKLADSEYVIKAEDLSASIVKTTGATKTVIEDIRKALIESDAKLLKKYLNELRELDLKTKNLLEQ